MRELLELLSNSNIDDSGSVVASGSWNVWLELPVRRCVFELAIVNTVVPPADTVEVILAK